MWYGLKITSRVTPELFGVVKDLSESTFRNLVYTVGGLCLAWFLIANAFAWWMYVPQITAIILSMVIFSTVALLSIHKQLVLAQSIWLFGVTVTFTLALNFFRLPEISIFYALLPLLAAALINWPAGIASEAFVIFMVLVLPGLGWIPALSTTYIFVVVFFSAVLLIIGWSIGGSLLSVALWSALNSQHGSTEMESMRDQRIEFFQVRDDLVLANKELTRLTDRLEAMQQIAEEARRVKEEFVANVSHELRTPLNMILGFTEIIMKSPQLYSGSIPSSLLADIAVIERNSHHLAKLVDDILDLSQVEAGHMALSKEWTSIAEIVNEATFAVHVLFESKGLFLKTDILPGLPQVFCDGTRIRQVVINLLSNAGRFTDQGGVAVRAWKDTNTVIISVQDTGPGIAEKDQKRIFEPFQQVDSPLHRHKGGSGLGLSISKQFVEMHGGKLWLESEMGAGTTFYFSLPVTASPPTLQAGSEDARRWFNPYAQYEVRIHQARLPKPEIGSRYVILEEEDTLQRFFSRYMDGVEVVGVRNLDNAIVELKHSPAQALILNLPPHQYSLSQSRLTELPFGTPVISCWVPGKVEAAKELGVVDYLVKPVSREQLFAALDKTGREINRVLVVDDEPEILQFFARMLLMTWPQCQILQALNGRRALQLLHSHKPDIILLDLIMPGMDGFQMLHEKSLDESIRDIPAIIITSKTPSGETIISDALTITRGNGLSLNELLTSIQNVSKILVPSTRITDPEFPKSPGEKQAS